MEFMVVIIRWYIIVSGNGAIDYSAANNLVVYNNKMYVGKLNCFVGNSSFLWSDGGCKNKMRCYIAAFNTAG